LPEVDQRPDDIVLAGPSETERRRVPVGLRVLREVLETPVALAGATGGGRVDAVEVADHGFDRGVEAVEIEPPEPDGIVGRSSAVVRPEPTHEVDHFDVPPHPGRKA